MADYRSILNTQVSDVQPPPELPTGTWKVRYTAWSDTKLNDENNPALLLMFKLVEPTSETEDEGLDEFMSFYKNDPASSDRTIIHRMSVDDAQQWRIKDLFERVLQYDPGEGGTFADLLSGAKGAECYARVTRTERDERVYENLRDFTPLEA